MSDSIENPAIASTAADSPLDAEVDLHALDDVTFEGRPTVLDRLGPAHFRSKGFSFMGFLQTVYDHVALHTGPQAKTFTPAEQTTDEPSPEAASETPAADPTAPTPADVETVVVETVAVEIAAVETVAPEAITSESPITDTTAPEDAARSDAPSTDDAQ